MRKEILLPLKTLLFCAALSPAYAQISQGGLPVSMQQSVVGMHIPETTAANPDWAAYLQKEKQMSGAALFSSPLTAGLLAPIDFRFPQSGRLVPMEDGSTVWQGLIKIENAPSIGLYLEQFELPKGVKMFLSNNNKKQILGAFDYRNNDASGKFAIDVLQGDGVFVELNIEAGVDLEAIKIYADQAFVMHRGIEHLKQFVTLTEQTIDQYDNQFNGRSSICTINAICPQGTDYADSRKATIQTVYRYSNSVGLCSGTLINTTGNTAESCQPLILTAAHCENTGTLNNASFSQTMVRFNFERATCDDTSATNGTTMTGVNIHARANITGSSASSVNGDFMLLELRNPIPASYGVVLAGWNRSNSIVQTETSPRKFIGFHHPAGDNKKLSTAQQISSRGTQGGGQNPNGSRWRINFSVGYAAGGSSGSGLFDGDGHLIGIASTGIEVNSDSCKVNAAGEDVQAMRTINYNKLWHGWEYTVDGTADNRRVKPWLDPLGTGVEQLDALSNCVSETSTSTSNPNSITDLNKALSAAISLSPNPSFDGNVRLHYNLKAATQLKIQITDVNGRIVYTNATGKVQSGATLLDLKGLNNGMYFVKIETENSATVKKLMLSTR